MMKITKDWFIPAPWGNIALSRCLHTYCPPDIKWLFNFTVFFLSCIPAMGKVVSWGDPSGEPFFLVHGRQDSAATFIPLLELLPDKYYFVGIDLPGNGKSDQFPIGLPAWRYYFLGAIDIAIKHLKWDKFIFMGHSMGCELGLFYNAIRPGHITKFVLLDPLPTFMRLQLRDHEKFFKLFVQTYYDNYHDYNYGYKVYTKRKALDAVMRARGFNEKQAEIVLARNLIQIGDDKYRLRWDKRTSFIVPQNYDNEYYSNLFSKSCPPILYLHMTRGSNGQDGDALAGAWELTELLKKNINNLIHVTLEGGHDAHVVSPFAMLGHINDFLEKKFVKAKL